MNLIVKEESKDAGRVEVCNSKMRTEQIRNELDKITAALVVRLSGNDNPICNKSPAVQRFLCQKNRLIFSGQDNDSIFTYMLKITSCHM